MSSESNASASAPASPSGGGGAQTMQDILFGQLRSVANKRATPSAQGVQAQAQQPAAPASPLAAAASEAPSYASADSKVDSPAAASHNVGEKGSLKHGRTSLMAVPAGATVPDAQAPRPSAGKRVAKNKADDRNRSHTEMAVDSAVASDPNLSDDLSLHIVELKFFYQMSLVQVAAGLITAVLSIYVASTGNSRAAGLIVTGVLATLTAVFARTAGTSILGRELSEGQKAMLAKLQLNTYELLFAYMYSSVILAVLSLSFALGELSLNDNLLGVAGLFLFCVLCIGTMLAVRSLSLKVVLHYSFQFLNLLFLLFGYAIIFLAGWAYKKNILSRYTSNANAWFAVSIVVGVSTVLISFWGILASRRRSKKWLLSYAIVLSVLLAGVLAAAIGVYTNDSIVDDAVNQNCANVLGDMAGSSVQDELGCVKYSSVGEGAADTCPSGFATTVWESSATTAAADADTIRFGCLNQQCCDAIKEYIHSNGRYLYLMALLGLVFGIAAVVAALYQRQMLRAGVKSDSMPNQEFYIMVAMTVLTIVCIVATPVAISTVVAPKLVPVTVDNNAALTVTSEVTLSGCGAIPSAALQYPFTSSCSQPGQPAGTCYLSVIIASQAADVQFPPHSDLNSIVIDTLDADGVTQRIEVSGLAPEINALFDPNQYGLNFCPFCLVDPASGVTFRLSLQYSGLNGAPAPAYSWADDVRVTTTASQDIIGVVKSGLSQTETPLAGVSVSYEMYGQTCPQNGNFGSVVSGADGRYTLKVPIPSKAGNGLSATVLFKGTAEFAEERTLVTIGGAGGAQPVLVPSVVMYPAPTENITNPYLCVNNGQCDPLTTCVPVTNSSRYCTHCPAGYSGNSDLQAGGTGCQDVNECAQTPNGGCHALTFCTNLPGTYNCSDCMYYPNGTATGFYGNGKSGCIDINECATNNGGVGLHRNCINFPGSFRAGECEFGFKEKEPPTADCENKNECAVGNGGCVAGVACIDSEPSAANNYLRYSCGPCPAGFNGDGFTCLSANPCLANNGGCSQNPLVECKPNAVTNEAECLGSPDGASDPNQCPHTLSYINGADRGFTGDGRTCTDINECVADPFFCPFIWGKEGGCVNTFGSVICLDIGEAQPAAESCHPLDDLLQPMNNSCSPFVTCTEQPSGPVLCGFCPSLPARGVYPHAPALDDIERPFQHVRGQAPDYPPTLPGVCPNVNECELVPNLCDPLAVCIDRTPLTIAEATQPGAFGTYGGFECACGSGTQQFLDAGKLVGNLPHGYRAQGLQCTPINVCQVTCDPAVSCVVDLSGAATCGVCPAGYRGSGTKAAGGCQLINSCQTNNGGCSLLAGCNNSTNPNTCNACPSGFTTTDGGRTCVDVNECLTDNGNCDARTSCVNIVGGRTCTPCPAGFVGSGDMNAGNGGCVDVNECAVNNGGCDPLTKCINEIGSYNCTACPAGYRGNAFGGCHLINECVEKYPCDARVSCTMIAGPPAKVQCGNCDPNYFRADSPLYRVQGGCVPIDQCAPNGGHGPCGTGLCTMDLLTNTSQPRAVCEWCPPGYTGTPPNCVDVDECAPDHPPVCSSNAACNNTIGGFSCGPCNDHYAGNPDQIEPPGCQAIDYCDGTHNPCYYDMDLHVQAPCVNVPPPARQCFVCPNNTDNVVVLTGDGYNCTDFNDCSVNNGGCDLTVACTDRYKAPAACAPCDPVFQTGAGTAASPCRDIDECDPAHVPRVCSPYVTCTNVVYNANTNAGVGYTCGLCPPGYIGTGYMSDPCTVPDLCTPNPCGLNSFCSTVEVPGVSVTTNCTCYPEYERLPGAQDCTPIQKCAASYVRPGCNPATEVCSYCDPLVQSGCTQLPGSTVATCPNCPAGFESGKPGTMSTGGCAQYNIDECATGADTCDPSVTCTDTTPSVANGGRRFECSDCMPPGYEPGSGYVPCVSHNFCADPNLINGNCSVNAQCTNIRGGRNCTCLVANGWVGDGITCVPDPTLCDAAHNPCDPEVTCSYNSPNPAPALCSECPPFFTGSGYKDLGGCHLASCPNENNGNCTVCTQCVMTRNGRTCNYNGQPNSCPPGYTGDGSFGGCTKVNLCTATTCGAGRCYMGEPEACDIAPKAMCECPPGYTGDASTGCVDVDECQVFNATNGGCSEHARCQNTDGSRLCLGCDNGYRGDPYSRNETGCVNINECNECACSPHSTCTDLEPATINDPGFVCSACAPGYRSSNADGTGTGCLSCVNINECAVNNGGCSVEPARDCFDVEPSPVHPLGYYCEACPTTYIESNTTNNMGQVFQVCTDRNECELVPRVCDPLTNCTNSEGGFQCDVCPCGLTSDSNDGTTPCRDVNECQLGYSSCPTDFPFCFSSASVPGAVAVVTSICTNGVRPNDAFPFRCGPCPTGYGPLPNRPDDGINCVNINECSASTSPCGANMDCTDTVGSFMCTCTAGFEPTPTGGCQPINPCVSNSNYCDASGDVPATCTYTRPGQATCSCPTNGFQGSGSPGSPCTNIDECADGNNGGCDARVTCVDLIPMTPGALTHYCPPCPTGWTGNSNVTNGCSQINPCALPTPPNGGCDPLTDCQHTGPGTRSCTLCPAPATQLNTTQVFWYNQTVNADGTQTCVDINECATANGGCWMGIAGVAPAVNCTNFAPTPANGNVPYVCGACPPGWVGSPRNCEDDDECSRNNGNCPANSNCANTPGSRTCTCFDGFRMVGGVCVNINECDEQHPCSQNPMVQCFDRTPNATNGWQKFECGPCPTGYEGTGVTCANINECATANGGCSVVGGSVCVDTPGNRTCGNCRADWGWQPKPGYTPCEVISHCLTNNGECDPATVCSQSGNGSTPIRAGVTCSVCPEYYVRVAPLPGTPCQDINECATDNGGCATGVTCINARGAPNGCGACPSGYTGDGFTCTDVNECLLNTDGCAHICINSPGSFQCACDSGYALGPDGKSCVDIDECLTGNGGCSPLATCTNTVGSRTCTCWEGTLGNGLTCADKNECADVNGGCMMRDSQAFATCINRVPNTPANGPFRDCQCPPNYTGTGVGPNSCTLTDVNLCATNNGGCDQNARCKRGVENPNTRTCKCNSGYSGDGVTCADINECLTNNGGCSRYCSPAVQCFNLPGSFYCGTCPKGYTGDGYTCVDINECATDNGGCYKTCTNTIGSYTCSSCPPGTTGTDGKTCVNINECRTGDHGCFPGATCTDMVPKATNNWQRNSCGACPTGYSGPAQAPPQTCTDVNECLSQNGGCFPGVPCINTVGSRKCGDGKCPAGYTGNGITCTDINECATQNGGCSTSCRPHVTCTNAPGGFSCGNCPTGYQGNSRVPNGCQDINECAHNNGGCGSNRLCTNSIGSWECGSCSAGYRAVGSTCVDVNECATNNGGCWGVGSVTGMKCFNTIGSHFCAYQPTNNGQCSDNCPSSFSQQTVTCNSPKCQACPPGYYGDGKTCTDINECQTNNGGCPTNSLCTNTPGSRSCGCPSGYRLEGNVCKDINECATNNGGCDPLTSCTNSPAGSYTCGNCPTPRFVAGNGKNGCVDVNECATNNGGCSKSPAVRCTNTRGGFSCAACPSGYYGDGKVCTDINECECNNGGCRGTCTNTPGSYVCGPCPSRWWPNPDFFRCALINECATNNGGCDPRTRCYETGLSIIGLIIPYYCGPCPSGFTGSGFTGCTDINECRTNNGGCFQQGSVKTTCTNTIGSRTCGLCPTGYDGDGINCIKRNAASAVTVKVISATTGRPVPNAYVRLRANTLQGRCLPWDSNDSINGAAGRTYLDRDDYPHGTPAYSQTTNSAGVTTFNAVPSGGWSIESNGALQLRLVCLLGCSPFDWCHSRCLWCDAAPTGYSHAFKYINVDGRNPYTFLLALSPTNLNLGQVRIVLSWDTPQNLNMHLTYATSTQQCDVSTQLAGTNCHSTDIVREQRDSVDGLMGVETYKIAVPRTTTYQVSVQNAGGNGAKPIYDTGATVSLYIGWGWWGSAWPYVMLPVAGADPAGQDPHRTKTYWAVYCAREYSWSGFAPLNKYTTELDWSYSRRGQTNTCPILRR